MLFLPLNVVLKHHNLALHSSALHNTPQLNRSKDV
jgi:hypothetical protein